jgi:ABC-type transport system involved in multi-copper enzyme maturation permease subunit
MNLKEIFSVTFKGILKDRVFHGILLLSVVMLLIPSVSQLSMRQVPELGMNLSLSLISFILFLLAVFLGGTVLWKDIERRYSYSVLSLPFSRTEYLWGKFLSVAMFNLLVALLLGLFSAGVVALIQVDSPPDRPFIWFNLFCAVGFDALKYTLLTACVFLFSTVSTSFFLPIFGAVTVFFMGSASQEVHEYLKLDAANELPGWLKSLADIFYYLIPNFSAFDLKANAIYAIPLDLVGLGLTAGYFLIYTVILLTIASLVFSRRELK